MRLGIFCVNGLRSFSGIPYHIVRTLKEIPGVQVELFPTSTDYRPPVLKRLAKRAERSIAGREYLWEKEPARCEHLSRQLDRELDARQVDAALIFGSEGCAFSKTDVPLFCYCDSIFGTRIDLYRDQQSARLSPASIREGVLVQELALKKLSKIFISSHWAYEQANKHFGYQNGTDKFEVVSIGANLPDGAATNVRKREEGVAYFTWIGVDWVRKRGNFAVEVVAALRERGVQAELNMIGDERPKRGAPWLRQHGRLSYDLFEDYAKLKDIYARSHALLLPTVGDLTPIAISESFAFGRPVVTAPVGGIPEMVTHGLTGLLLQSDSPRDWAEAIDEAFRTGALVGMGSACRNMYETALNWSVICHKMVTVISDELQNRAVTDLKNVGVHSTHSALR